MCSKKTKFWESSCDKTNKIQCKTTFERTSWNTLWSRAAPIDSTYAVYRAGFTTAVLRKRNASIKKCHKNAKINFMKTREKNIRKRMAKMYASAPLHCGIAFIWDNIGGAIWLTAWVLVLCSAYCFVGWSYFSFLDCHCFPRTKFPTFRCWHHVKYTHAWRCCEVCRVGLRSWKLPVQFI